MKIRMVTLMAGPDGVFLPGQVVDLVDETAGHMLVAAGFAQYVDSNAPRRLETTAVEPPERAVAERPRPKVAGSGGLRSAASEKEGDVGAPTLTLKGAREIEELVHLVGKRAGKALVKAGYGSLASVREALGSGVDLTAIDGVGPATIRKLREK